LYDLPMNARSWNWRLWSGLAMSAVAFISYPTLFARWPVTRDFPWANLLLFAIAIILLISGVRRARRKTLPVITAAAGTAVLVAFVMMVFVAFKQLPPAHGAPRIGSRAPDFNLLDTTRTEISLSQLVASSPRGVLLVFYRGYW
jgi:hypothetical protein